MMPLEIYQFPYRDDNYGVLLHDPVTGETVSIDAGSEEAEAERKALADTGWRLTQLWVTHHHYDHCEGIMALKKATGCTVYGPSGSKQPIKGIDVYIEGGQSLRFAGKTVEVIHTPGHTLDMLNFFLPQEKLVFTGDTLFVLGCGPLFEGTPAMMFESMTKLKRLPRETKVYCSHEYGQINAAFALSIDSSNGVLIQRARDIDLLRARGEPTVPTTIGQELETNPYFRCDDSSIRAHLNMATANDVEVFAEIRKRRDVF